MAFGLMGVVAGATLAALGVLHQMALTQERRLVARLLAEGVTQEAMVREGKSLVEFGPAPLAGFRWVQRVLAVPARVDGNGTRVQRRVQGAGPSRAVTVDVEYPDRGRVRTLGAHVAVGAEHAAP